MKTLLLRSIGPICLLLLGLLLSEGLLRIVPSPAQYPPLYDFDYKDSLLGIELFPNAKNTEKTSCYEATMTTNSFGWRGREWTKKRVPGLARIAVLGDSFMAGTQVNDDEVFSAKLEEKLGKDKVEVLNFGMSSIGTEQEDILYEYVVKKFDPDIVLLAFYNNDPENSDPDLEGGPSHQTRLTFRDGSGGLINFRKSTPLDGTRHWLRMHSAFYRFAVVLYHLTQQKVSSPSGPTGYPPYPREFGVFESPPNAQWEHAWQRVERAIRSLKQQIKPPKHLLTFSVPEIVQTAPDPAVLIRKDYGRDPPAGFRPKYPIERFAGIAATNNVQFVDLLPRFLAEQQKRQLQYPYFFFTCNGHWNTLGHEIAADEVAKAIEPLLPH